MLVNLEDVLGHAYRHGYAVGAFNVINLEFLNGILEAAERQRSPVVVQIAEVHFKYVDIEEITPAIQHMANRATVPVVLSLDHGESVGTIVRAIRCGFTAVMFDGSKLPFEENVEQTRLVVQIAHSVGVSVEAELGRVGSSEGAEGGVAREEFFTDPEQAEEFVRRTGVDALAVAIGNVHGFYRGEPKLDLERLKEIRDRTGIPLVLHGGSGIPDEDFRKAIGLGISKINYFTEMSRKALQRVKEVLQQDSRVVGLHDLILEAKEAIREEVEDRITVFGSAGVCERRNDICSTCQACDLGKGPVDEGRLVEMVTQTVIRMMQGGAHGTGGEQGHLGGQPRGRP
ncbi:MAG TPA: class II fructose-bisphosphate aldolase [Candidatus Latescibacteria bacterium]|nr:class II fructose-bisphosphate aldolase [Candidatus Latescibacterota bacterium]